MYIYTFFNHQTAGLRISFVHCFSCLGCPIHRRRFPLITLSWATKAENEKPNVGEGYAQGIPFISLNL